MKIPNLIENSGSLGTVISAMGCASCFPAAASIGSGLGLGFLATFEGLFINTLLPVFAIISLILQIFTAWQAKSIIWLIAGVTGPLMVLATLYLFWSDNWSTYMFYAGIILMLIVSVWQRFRPASTCAVQN